MIPTIGRSVHYRLSKADAKAINLEKTHNHVGAAAFEGDVFPATIVKVWGESPGISPGPDALVNLQVLIDGNFTFWATSRSQISLEDGVPAAGHWAEPLRRN